MKHFPRSGVAVTFITALLLTGTASAQRIMEKLDRGLVAVKSGSGYFLSWRLFGTDPQDNTFGFNVYRGTTKLNSAVITNATSYQDNSSGSGTYTVKPVTSAVEGEASEAAIVLSQNYLSIPMQVPPSGKTPLDSTYTYSANDCSPGDLDGDGQYEIVVKWYPSNAQDNAFSGYTGNTILDAYKLNGTRLWRIDLGKNIRSGAHYTQFLVYDFDGNGKAEVVCKTADGTVDGKGKVIGDATADWRSKDGYVTTTDGTGSRTLADGTMVADLIGRIMSGPEYLTVFDGPTGAADTTVDYKPPRGATSSWGDSYGNRGERYLGCVAYLDGVHPSVIPCRGYYTRTTLWALDWRGGKLIERWFFDSNVSGNGKYAGQGCHSIREGDVDTDGFDEIVYGACTIDHDGKGLYSTGLNHGDALHMSDMDPGRAGLEVWQVHESPSNSTSTSFRDANNGTVIWKNSGTGDNGRGMAAPLVSGTKGWQVWSGSFDGLFNTTGSNAGSKPGSNNFAVWWDGDLERELEDGTSVTKYGGGSLVSASGCTSNNGSKSNPCLTADIFGDWREEVIWRNSSSGELRVYTTTTATTNRLYTLMHDPVYRLSVASENVAYNQPPEPGIYIGYGMSLPQVKPSIAYPTSTVISYPSISATIQKQHSMSKKVFGGRTFVIPGAGSGTLRTVKVYGLSGTLVKRIVTQNRTIDLKECGLSEGVYLAKIGTGGAR